MNKPGLLRRQAANAVTLLALVPLVLVLRPGGAALLPAALLMADAIDSLDGVVARGLGTSSPFGAQLDRSCDILVHGGLIAFAGAQLPGAWGILALAPMAAIAVRLTRQSRGRHKGLGSSTNELLRHLYAALLLIELGAPMLLIPLVFILHSVTMVWARPMPYLLRRWARAPRRLLLFYGALLLPLLVEAMVLPVALALLVPWALSAAVALRGRDGPR